MEEPTGGGAHTWSSPQVEAPTGGAPHRWSSPQVEAPTGVGPVSCSRRLSYWNMCRPSLIPVLCSSWSDWFPKGNSGRLLLLWRPGWIVVVVAGVDGGHHHSCCSGGDGDAAPQVPAEGCSHQLHPAGGVRTHQRYRPQAARPPGTGNHHTLVVSVQSGIRPVQRDDWRRC